MRAKKGSLLPSRPATPARPDRAGRPASRHGLGSLLGEAADPGNNGHVGNEFGIDFDGPSRHRRLHLRGELDLVSSQDLIRALRRACDEGARSVMLDLRDVGHVDSAGIYALLSGRKICEENGCGYVIERGMSGPAEKTLEVTGLLDQLPFC